MFPKVVVLCILPEAVVKRLYLFHLSTPLIVCSFHFSHFSGRVVVWHSSFAYISLVTDSGAPFCIWAIWISFLETCPSLCPFVYWVSIFFHNDLCIFFVYPGCNTFIRYRYCECLLPICGLPFYALNFFFWWTQIFNFNRAQFISISLLLLMLLAYLQIRELFSSKN